MVNNVMYISGYSSQFKELSLVIEFRGISLLSVCSNLFSNIILLRLRNAVDQVLREEQCGLRTKRGYVNQIFILELIIEKYLSYQTPLVLCFKDYEQAFNSVDRRALAQVPSLCGIQDKLIRVITAMYENNTAVVKVGNGVSSWFSIKAGIKPRLCFIPLYMDQFEGHVLKSTGKAVGKATESNGEENLPGETMLIL